MVRKYSWRLMMESIGGGDGFSERMETKTDWWLKLVVFAVVGMMMARMVFLQVVLGEKQMLVAEGNRLERKVLLAGRGVIKDREGRVLARNVEKDGGVAREYPYGEATAHVVGYVGEVSGEEVAAGELLLGEKIGKMGVERSVDEKLRGSNGEELVEVNASGSEVGVVGRREAASGQSAILSIDAELSKEVVQVLRQREEREGRFKGAVVVSRAGMGEILSLVSWPSFDGNLFSGLKPEGRYKTVAEVLGDNQWQPLFDRAVGGSYPPGSVYKLITAVAGVEEGKVNETTTVLDEGEIRINEFRYGNWYFDQYGRTDGEIGLVRAMARSNDIFFYKVGEWVGIEKLGEWSRKFGLGRKTGIGLEAEATGRVPDPLWKERLTGERWFLGNTYHMAIGQGDLTMTPLQVSLMTEAVVSGKLCKPGLIKGEEGRCLDLGLSQLARELVVRGMVEACSPGGTGSTFFDFPVRVACKTGTSQQGGEDDKPHSWMTVVVPEERRRGVEGDQKKENDDGQGILAKYRDGVVITVLLEASGEGSREAGAVAAEIVKFVIKQGI